LEALSAVEKRCRRCALPPQSKILIPTNRFNEAFKRNRQRFPDDFAFQLTAAKFADLKSKPAISKVQDVAKQENAANSSQIAMSSAQVPETRRNHGGDGVEQSRSRGDERVCGAGVHADARATGGQHSHSQTAGGN
jgi:hypothetical protein